MKMPRIRTIKPEFHKDIRLYRLDHETGLPCRLCYIALWSVADREGRIRWRPEEIRVDTMPHDDQKLFDKTVEALRKGKYLRFYVFKGEKYVFIPTLKGHQMFNPKEPGSALPPPPNDPSRNLKRALSRGSRVDDASGTGSIGKGREGNGRERNGSEGKGREEKGSEQRVGDRSAFDEGVGSADGEAREPESSYRASNAEGRRKHAGNLGKYTDDDLRAISDRLRRERGIE